KAASIADQSTPPCVVKRASSDAITARFRLSEIASYGTQRKSMLASGSFLRSRSSSARMKAVEPGSTWLHHSTWPKYQNCTARKTVTIAASVQARPRRTMRPGPARLPRPRVAIGTRRALRLAGARAIGSGARVDARPDRGEDPRRRRANPAPHREGFGGLLDEHAQPVARLGTARGERVAHEARRPGAVDHVVGEPGRRPERVRDRQACIGQAGGRRIDRDVDAQPREAIEAARSQARIPEARHQLRGLVGTPRDDDEALHVGGEQRTDHAARGAAGAQQDDAGARQRDAQPTLQVGDETETVGVVGPDAVGIEAERVRRARLAHPLRWPVRQCGGLALEGDGDVEAAAARLAKRRDRGDEAVDRREQALVGERLATFAGEARVDLGRQAVGDRGAEHRVAVDGAAHCDSLVRSAPLVKVQVRTIWRMSPSRAISGGKGSYGAPANTISLTARLSTSCSDLRLITMSTTLPCLSISTVITSEP